MGKSIRLFLNTDFDMLGHGSKILRLKLKLITQLSLVQERVNRYKSEF